MMTLNILEKTTQSPVDVHMRDFIPMAFRLTHLKSEQKKSVSTWLTFFLVFLAHTFLIYVLLKPEARLLPQALPPEAPMMVSLLENLPQAPINEVKKSEPIPQQPVSHNTKTVVNHQPKTSDAPQIPASNIQVSQDRSVEVEKTSPPIHEEQQAVDAVESNASATKVSEVAEKSAKEAQVKEEVIEAPRFGVAYLNNPKPNYPNLSRRAGEQGRVLFKVLVNVNGEAETVEVLKSSGFERLDQAGFDAVKQWRFVPAKRNSQAISAYVTVPISFSLDR
jgi:periplasmic protein TonB